MHARAARDMLAEPDARMLEAISSLSGGAGSGGGGGGGGRLYHCISDVVHESEGSHTPGRLVLSIKPAEETSKGDPLMLSAGFPLPDGTPCRAQDRVFISADKREHYTCLACKSHDCRHVRSLGTYLEEQDRAAEAPELVQFLRAFYQQRPSAFSFSANSSAAKQPALSTVLRSPWPVPHRVTHLRGRGLLTGAQYIPTPRITTE